MFTVDKHTEFSACLGFDESRLRSPSSPTGTLPNARRISSILMQDINKSHANLTLYLMQMGQFIDHDSVLAAVPTGL